jgi:hypothetical protein
MNTAPSHTVSCTCGTTRFVCDGPHIIVTECYCDSCRKAATILEALPDAPKVLEPSSGTWFVLHRKDRIKPITSTEHLREHRLTPESSTRRIVATCCNAPMFLDFAQGHWFSVYARRFPPNSIPAIEERTMLRDMPEGFSPPLDARNARRWSAGFMTRLFWAWVRMGFRTPTQDWVKGSLH